MIRESIVGTLVDLGASEEALEVACELATPDEVATARRVVDRLLDSERDRLAAIDARLDGLAVEQEMTKD